MYSEHCQTSTMECFAIIVQRLKLIIFGKSSTLDVWQGSEHASGKKSSKDTLLQYQQISRLDIPKKRWICFSKAFTVSDICIFMILFGRDFRDSTDPYCIFSKSEQIYTASKFSKDIGVFLRGKNPDILGIDGN